MTMHSDGSDADARSAMHRCCRCGKPLRAEAKYCPVCGGTAEVAANRMRKRRRHVWLAVALLLLVVGAIVTLAAVRHSRRVAEAVLQGAPESDLERLINTAPQVPQSSRGSRSGYFLGGTPSAVSGRWMLDPIISYGQMKPPQPATVPDAAMRGDLRLLQRLIQAGADVNAPDGEFAWTALHWAAWQGAELTARALLSLAAGRDVKDTNDMTPLHIAAMQGSTSVAAVLLAGGARVDARNRWGHTPLHLAAACGHQAVAKVLIDGKADVGARGSHGETPLHAASHNPSMTEYLLKRGADWNVRDHRGETPLGLAMRLNITTTSEVLRAHGATESR